MHRKERNYVFTDYLKQESKTMNEKKLLKI